MKTFNFILTFCFLICLFFSCESEIDKTIKNSMFKLKFSNGTEITETDIKYYDSATHFLYLKENLDFNKSITGYSVFVDDDTIYKGIIQSCALSSLPKSPYFISDCFSNGYNIVEFGFISNSKDLRNDTRIINSLKSDNLLRNGLSCSIDSIVINSFDNYSEVTCKITIANHDTINYYILDKNKMGELDFNYYTGGLSFININTKSRSFLKWSISSPTWSDLSMNDLSILASNSKVSYTFKSSDYYKMENGYYNATFSFRGISKDDNLNIEQNDGRIWIGYASATRDSILVK